MLVEKHRMCSVTLGTDRCKAVSESAQYIGKAAEGLYPSQQLNIGTICYSTESKRVQ